MFLLAGCSKPAEPVRPFTYVAIGASDAVGIGARDPETEGWVSRLGASFGPQARVINLGVNGSTVARAIQEQLDPAVDAQPDLVTIWLAANDLNSRTPLERYAAGLDRLLGGLAPTGACVLVGNLPDLTLAPIYARADPAALRASLARWNAAIADVSARHGAQVVDLYARWQELSEHPEYVSADGFHPSSEGHARLAELFAEAHTRDC